MTEQTYRTMHREISDPEELREATAPAASCEAEADGMSRDLMLAVARDMHAMEVYAKMNETQRAIFLARARQTPAGEAMQKMVHDLQYGDLNL